MLQFHTSQQCTSTPQSPKEAYQTGEIAERCSQGTNPETAVNLLQVKYTQQNWHERLSTILDEFPKVDDIHPFYADLLNVLYDRDHYKLALGQLNVARSLIDKVAQGQTLVTQRDLYHMNSCTAHHAADTDWETKACPKSCRLRATVEVWRLAVPLQGAQARCTGESLLTGFSRHSKTLSNRDREVPELTGCRRNHTTALKTQHSGRRSQGARSFRPEMKGDVVCHRVACALS